MSIVPSPQLLVQWGVGQLRGVLVHVRERQARHSVRQRVRVEGVRHISVVTLHTVHCIKHTAHQEAVSVATTSKTCAEALYRLQVSGVEVDEQDYFLMKAFGVQSRVKQPQAGLIDSKLHLEKQHEHRGPPI